MRIAIYVFISFFVLGCSNSQIITSDNQSIRTEKGIQKFSITTKGALVNSDLFDAESDPFNIQNVEIVNDSLIVEVNFGGGCELHDFTLVSPGFYAESMPPQLSLVLHYQASNISCKSLINKSLSFDLKPIRYNNSGTLLIRLKGAEGVYEYKY